MSSMNHDSSKVLANGNEPFFSNSKLMNPHNLGLAEYDTRANTKSFTQNHNNSSFGGSLAEKARLGDMFHSMSHFSEGT